MGVQGGDSMENEAQGPKFDLWLPRCLFGFFLGIQKEARRRKRRNTHARRASACRAALSAEMRRNTPNPAPQAPNFPRRPQAAKSPCEQKILER